MNETDRRKFLAVAGAGAAAGVVGLAAGPAAASAPRARDGVKESVVAYVHDHHSDELLLMVGERQVVVHDRDLVTRILGAAGGQ